MMARFSNPFAFSRGPVTLIACSVYAALIAILIVVQVDLPSVPSSPTPVKGINLTEAWQDLQLLTGSYHNYNSHQNDYVHDWLVSRIKSILKEQKTSSTDAYIFDDDISNVTGSAGSVHPSAGSGIIAYFEGKNIIVYIRGSKDEEREWWIEPDGKPETAHGVMVNAHYDSVSTGYGSTDDGVGVVSVLQLLRYFTTKSNKPRNGVVLLLNDGEEDFLNGARAFGQHPMSKFVHTFLNLEGAGAGGRALMFRSTDEEVTRAYGRSPHPWGTVMTGDVFERGVLRSQTDYVIFNGAFGYRGLDLAFVGPRSRYHTGTDDSRHTGKKALWHMLSAAVATADQLTRMGINPSTESHRFIWFDILGRGFVLMQAHTFFALSVALLVIGPIVLLLTLVTLARADKLYLFSSSQKIHTSDGDTPVSLYGLRGFFRFPCIVLVAGAAPIALAYLIFKENQQVVHSSPWPVWAMMGSSFICVAWFLSRFADYLRPSALTRAYGFGWLWFAWWVFLVVALIHEEQFHLTAGYFALFYAASAFLSCWISYLELFSLPKKSVFSKQKMSADGADSRPTSSRGIREERVADNDDDDDEPTEQSSLLRRGGRSVYKTVSREQADDRESERSRSKTGIAKYDEQEWSAKMWDWMWLLNFLIIIPINVILLCQIGFLAVETLHQTGADGSVDGIFITYLVTAIITILIFSPAVPMMHRLTWHVPTFLFMVLVGTILYNLLAFPFSPQNQMKLYFQQQVDFDFGNNTVSLVGLSPYLEDTVSNIPSASGHPVKCSALEARTKCSWTGPPPHVAGVNGYVFSKSPYSRLLHYNASIVTSGRSISTATFSLGGGNTRNCRLYFDSPISTAQVQGQAPEDKRLPGFPEQGSQEVRLWSRTWNRTWTVDITWDSKVYGKTLSGKAACEWSDLNQKGVIPAFDEVEHYVPTWVTISKFQDGLVEGYKRFNIT